MPIKTNVYPQYRVTGVEVVAEWTFRTRARVVPFAVRWGTKRPVFVGRLLSLRQRLSAIRVLKSEVGALHRFKTREAQYGRKVLTNKKRNTK
jgi:hypothetical protein